MCYVKLWVHDEQDKKKKKNQNAWGGQGLRQMNGVMERKTLL